MSRKPKPGAPPRAPRGTATEQLQVRLSAEQLRRIQRAAAQAGPTQSEWLRQALLREADAVLGRET